mgnify:CR=1 FL=1
MKKFLRENPTIAFGLGLPLLLVIIFLLISGVPTLLVAPPQFDVVYATKYNQNYPNGVQISVVKQRVKINYLGKTLAYQHPRLWRYSAKTGAVREIAIMLPAGLAPAGQIPAPATTSIKVRPIDVPDLANVTIDASSIAPDGYQFGTGNGAYSRRVFTGLFYSSYYRDRAELTKNGRSIRLPHSDGAYYGNQTHFIGWVVSP